MEAVIQKWGNSLGIRIPSVIAKQLNLKDGSKVSIVDENGKILILPNTKTILQEKLDRISENNIHLEIDSGKPIGNEIW